MESRQWLGGKASIRRSLGVLPGDTTSSAALAMYSRVHSEVEALMTVDMSVIRLDKDRFPLSGKEMAGHCWASPALYPRCSSQSAADVS